MLKAVMEQMIIPLELEQDAIIKKDSEGKLWLQWSHPGVINGDSDRMEYLLPATTIEWGITQAKVDTLLTYFGRNYAVKATTFSASR